MDLAHFQDSACAISSLLSESQKKLICSLAVTNTPLVSLQTPEEDLTAIYISVSPSAPTSVPVSQLGFLPRYLHSSLLEKSVLLFLFFVVCSGALGETVSLRCLDLNAEVDSSYVTLTDL